MTRDPVCGMQIDEETAKGEVEFEDQTYFLCMSNCRDKFAQAPKTIRTRSATRSGQWKVTAAALVRRRCSY